MTHDELKKQYSSIAPKKSTATKETIQGYSTPSTLEELKAKYPHKQETEETEEVETTEQDASVDSVISSVSGKDEAEESKPKRVVWNPTTGESHELEEKEGSIVKGALQQYGGSLVSAFGDLARNMGATQYMAEANAMEQASAINQAKGKSTDAEVKTVESEADALREQAEYDRSGQNENITAIENKGVEMSQEGAEEIEAKKATQGKIGQVLTDIAVQGIQMGADAATNLLAPGMGLATMAARTYGSGVQSAKAEGAEADEATLYGVATAATEVLTEKLFDGAAKIYGKGAADDMVDEWIGKLAKSDAGQKVWKLVFSTMGEAAEEGISDIVEPVSKLLYSDKTLRENYKESFSNILYDMFIGAVLGGLGGGVEVASGSYVTPRQQAIAKAMAAEVESGKSISEATESVAKEIIEEEKNTSAVTETATEASEAVTEETAETAEENAEAPADTADTATENTEAPAETAEPVNYKSEARKILENPEALAQFKAEYGEVQGTTNSQKRAYIAEVLARNAEKTTAETTAESEAVQEEPKSNIDLMLENQASPELSENIKTNGFGETENTPAKTAEQDNADLMLQNQTNADADGYSYSVDGNEVTVTAPDGTESVIEFDPRQDVTPEEIAQEEIERLKAGKETPAQSNADLFMDYSDEDPNAVYDDEYTEDEDYMSEAPDGTEYVGDDEDNVRLFVPEPSPEVAARTDTITTKGGEGRYPTQSSSTYAARDEAAGVQPEQRYDNRFSVDETNERAQARFDADPQGEINRLMETKEWTADDQAEANIILAALRKQLVESGGDPELYRQLRAFEKANDASGTEASRILLMRKNNAQTFQEDALEGVTKAAEQAGLSEEESADLYSKQFEFTEELKRIEAMPDDTTVENSTTEAEETVSETEATETVEAEEELESNVEAGQKVHVPGSESLGTIVGVDGDTVTVEVNSESGETETQTFTEEEITSENDVDGNGKGSFSSKSTTGTMPQIGQRVDTGTSGLTGEVVAINGEAVTVLYRDSKNKTQRVTEANGKNLHIFPMTEKSTSPYDPTMKTAMRQADEVADAAGLSEKEKGDLLEKQRENTTKLETQLETDEGPKHEAYEKLIKDIAESRGLPVTDSIAERLKTIPASELEKMAKASVLAVNADVTKASKQGIGAKVKSFQMISYLFNIPTAGRNIAGNETHLILDGSIAQNVAHGIGKLMAKITGLPNTCVGINPYSKNAAQAFKLAWNQSLVEVALDVSPGNAYGASNNFNQNGSPVEKAFFRLSQMLSYGLNMPDALTRARVEAEVTEGLKNSYADPETVAEAAEEQADFELFMDDNGLTELAQKVHDLFNLAGFGGEVQRNSKGKATSRKGGFGVGDVVAPFVKVPTNLAVKSAQYSPASTIYGIGQLVHVMNNANKAGVDKAQLARTQNEACKNIARGITGTGAIAFSYVLSRLGIIKKSDDDDDYDIANTRSIEGRSNTQINVSALTRMFSDRAWKDGDTIIEISSLEPLNAFIEIGCLIDENTDGEKSAFENAGAITASWFVGTYNAVLEMPMLSALTDAYSSMQYVDTENGWTKAGEFVGSYAQNLITGAVPSIVKNTAKAVDPLERDTSGDNWFSETVNKVIASIPGASTTLPTKKDIFGNGKRRYTNDVDNVLNSLVLPLKVQEYDPNETVQKLDDMYELTGESSIYPSRKVSNFSVNGEKLELTTAEKQKYLDVYTSTYGSFSSKLLDTEVLSGLSTDEQLAIFNLAEDWSADLAKWKIASDRGLDYEPNGKMEDFVTDVVNGNISASDWVGAYMKYKELSNTEDTATVKQTKFKAWMLESGYDEKTADTLSGQFKYYSMNAADTKRLDNLVEAGFEADTAAQVVEDMTGVGSKNADKLDQIASLSYLDPDTDVDAVVLEWTSEACYKGWLSAKQNGWTLAQYSEYYRKKNS